MNIPILVTLDEHYIPQLEVLLTSLKVSHPGRGFDVHLLHSAIPDEALLRLAVKADRLGFRLFPIRVDGAEFAGAKVTDRYPKEMYYRLLAARWLPGELEKILYLDPDILVINPLDRLWETDLTGYLFAAASHTGKAEPVNSVNHLRLGTETDYFNSGVLLINLKAAREEIRAADVFDYAERNARALLLPDQDVLNALYGGRILPLDDMIWNYDARNYGAYLLRSGGEANLPWVMENTAILHFCGREKPWKPHYKRRFAALYRHYMSLAARYFGAA